MIILPCTKSKAFNSIPTGLPAGEAYIGQMFLKGKKFAQRVGESYVILSAKYGWLYPHEIIYNYEQTFKKTKPDYLFLIKQVAEKGIKDSRFIVLGGEVYSCVVRKCFPDAVIIEPLKGLSLGFKLQLLGDHVKLQSLIQEV